MSLLHSHQEIMESELKIPVFVFPNTLTFILEDKSTHKQILSLYNPYGYPVKYRVLSTSPDRYIVSTPEGIIQSQYRADIVVRHNDVKSSNCDVVDKFRIHMHEKTNKKVLGRQDVNAVLRSKKSMDSHIPNSEREDFKIVQGSYNQSLQTTYLPTDHYQNPSSSTNPVILVIAVICIAGLWLPTDNDDNKNSFITFRISIGLKLIFSYVLGLVTMVILRP